MSGFEPLAVSPVGALIQEAVVPGTGMNLYDHVGSLFDLEEVQDRLNTSSFVTISPPMAVSEGAGIGITIENTTGYPMVFDLMQVTSHDVTDKANKVPATYFDSHQAAFGKTNGNTVDRSVVTATEGSSLILAPAPQVLMQPVRTNILEKSNEVDAPVWGRVGLTPAPAQPGFAGFPQSVYMEVTAGNVGHYFLQDVSIASGTSYVFTAIVKPAGYEVLQITGSSGFAHNYSNFILTGAGSIGNESGATQQASITALEDGAYLITYIDTATSSTASGRLIIAPNNIDTTDRLAPYTGDGVSGVSFAHVGIVAGDMAGMPIQTDDAPVTTSSDSLQFSKSQKWAPSSLLFIMSFTPSASWSTLSFETLFELGGSSNQLLHRTHQQNGLSSSPQFTSINAGNTAGQEITACVISNEALDVTIIGYRRGTGAFQWDATPAAFQEKTYTDISQILRISAETTTIRAALIYKGLPQKIETLAEIKAWVEANAEGEIIKSKG